MKIVTSEQMKQVDRTAIQEFGIPGIVLMENAGLSVLEEVMKSLKDKTNQEVVIVCGRGNNGGDGFVVARHLANKGVPVKVCIMGNPSLIDGDAKTNYEMIHKIKVEIYPLAGVNNLKKFADLVKECSIIVDAVFGTGLNSEIDNFIKEIIDIINASGKEVISIDLPSGICGNDGTVCGIAVRAYKTIVLQLPKLGNINYPGNEYNGQIILKDISIPPAAIDQMNLMMNLITQDTVKNILPMRKKDTYKGDYGKAYIVAGSTGMTGAAMLACEAALRSGAGLLKIPVPQSLNTIMEVRLTEAITLPLPDLNKGVLGISDIQKVINTMKEADVIGIGPGSGQSREIEELLRNIFEHFTKPIVLDADALNALAKRKELFQCIKSPVVITPHIGEMARLTELDIEYIRKQRIKVAVDFAKKWKITVLLKGTKTIVAGPNGEVYINETGNPGMATAGSGDVLTGIITGFIAQGIEPTKATIAAVYVHGCAGDRVAERLGEYGMIAGDMVKELPFVIKDIVGR
ncbi:NAD(P)H-hydrate dehydratase [Clostridiaceae bacterium 35-E11]